jgi:hypothetical protein
VITVMKLQILYEQGTSFKLINKFSRMALINLNLAVTLHTHKI